LFKDKALQHFKEYTRPVDSLNEDRVKRDKTPWDDDQKFFEVLDQVAKEFFPVKHAYRRQCFYLRYHLYIGGKFVVHEFMAPLHRINACIPYFPRKSDTQGIKYCKRLPDNKLCDILNLAKKPEWTIKMLEANQDAYDYDPHGLSEYLKRLCDILNLAKKPEWTIKMLEANQDAYDYDLHGLSEYLERLCDILNLAKKPEWTVKML
jgi:preprotein translocase subunit Sss1